MNDKPEPLRMSDGVDALLTEFFEQDDLRQLTADAGGLLGCPLMVVDDAFAVVAHFCPVGFSDPLFRSAVSGGALAYETDALVSENPDLKKGVAAFVRPDESPYLRRFAPLACTGVRLGYLIAVDTDGHLRDVPEEIFAKIEKILAKQLFIEASRQDKPFETAEELLMHLLDGGFSSAPAFRLRAAGTYLADFHPSAFALIDLSAYHNGYLGSRHLKEELNARFPQSHSFLYRGDVFLFLHGERQADIFSELASEFGLRVVISEPVTDLFLLPSLYRAAHDALGMIVLYAPHGKKVFPVAELRTPLLLQNLGERDDLLPPELRALAALDKKKNSNYCETLYFYLICNHSLKKTCDALFTHRNTVLYRIGKIREDFAVPLDDPAKHTELLLGTALLLFRSRGPEFFLRTPPAGENA